MGFDNESRQSNLDRFLGCTTPVVPSQSLPKSETRNLNRLWYTGKEDDVEFFRLSDLWNCFDELSAYGAGVPISLTSGETLVQYYVPYLSAIQIFTSHSTLNHLREETESGESEARDSSSDSFSDEWRWEGCSSEEGFDSDRLIHFDDRLGYLYFHYVETSAPYSRVPLMDKITQLAGRFPGLMSLRSVDLSPASWMSVAWYPIYHIPMGRTIKDLSTCFLTYHTLSSSFQDTNFEDDMEEMEGKKDKREGIPLTPFGLATYKMQGSIWASGDSGRDQERLMCLMGVAESWLKQLRVQHHDFNYFTGIRHG